MKNWYVSVAVAVAANTRRIALKRVQTALADAGFHDASEIDVEEAEDDEEESEDE